MAPSRSVSKGIRMHEEHELPMLAGIANFFHWLEELLVILSGPMLTAGLFIGFVDLLSDGQLLFDVPWLLITWAVAQAVGADGQLIGAWARVGKAGRRKDWAALFGFLLLGFVLAYIAFVSALVFAYQEAYHITTNQALAKLGMDTVSWLWQRTAVSVGLVALSGLLRYTAPKMVAVNHAEQMQMLSEQMELDALKRQARGKAAQGWVSNVKGAAKAATGQGEPEEVSAAPVPLARRTGSRSH